MDESKEIKPWSKLCVEGGTALVFKTLDYVVLTEEMLRDRQVGHGVLLKELGFYPIGHKQGIVVLSYWDEIQRAIIYEKLIFKEAIPSERVRLESKRLEEDERLFSF